MSDTMPPRRTPEAILSESALLGYSLRFPDAFARVRAAGLDGHWLFRRDHQVIFGAACRLVDRGLDVTDPVLLLRELNTDLDGGHGALGQLIDDAVRLEPANVDEHIRVVRETWQARETIRVLRAAADDLERDPQAIRNGFMPALASRLPTVAAVEATQYLEPAPAFLRRLTDTPAPRMLVAGFLPADGITLIHAHPRLFKTWVCLDLAVSITAAVPAFRALHVSEAARVGYFTNEDSAKRVQERLDGLLAGHGLDDAPDDLYLGIHRGAWLDDPECQARLIGEARALRLQLIIFDPLRSLTAAVDQGPRELQPFAQFCRRLINETGAALLLSHHDTKPPVGQSDNRRRPHRASGGGLFSVADNPIHLERLDDEAVLAVPDAWKFTDTPPPLRLVLDVTPAAATLTATAATGTDAATAALHTRILDYLAAHPGTAGTNLAAALGGKRQTVYIALDDLMARHQITFTKHGNGKYWSLTTVPDCSRTVPELWTEDCSDCSPPRGREQSTEQ